MDTAKIGKAIAYLRKRAGYTQRDLAERIGISDKAVSKWERGLGLPDIAYLGKLAILLDTDSDSLLAGDVIHHDRDWQGLLILEESSCGIGADTIIYDKPLVYFLLGYFMLMGVDRIAICCSRKDELFLRSRLGAGEKYGMSLLFCRRPDMEQKMNSIFSDCKNVMLVWGRSLVYGADQTRFFQRAMVSRDRVTLLSIPKQATGKERIVSFDVNMKEVSYTEASKIATQYEYTPLPIAFVPKKYLGDVCHRVGALTVEKDMRGTPCVEFYTEVLDRGFVELTMDNWEDVAEASSFVRIVQKACGMKLYCLEEIAWRRGLIGLSALERFAKDNSGIEYGEYLWALCRKK